VPGATEIVTPDAALRAGPHVKLKVEHWNRGGKVREKGGFGMAATPARGAPQPGNAGPWSGYELASVTVLLLMLVWWVSAR
jgi:hypothetical protein